MTIKTICFDLDGLICTQREGDYENAVFDKQAIKLINRLYNEGYKIIIYTARFMGRNKGDVAKTYEQGYKFTTEQLKKNKIRFHELVMGKPRYDIVVDDRAVFFTRDWQKIEDEIKKLK